MNNTLVGADQALRLAQLLKEQEPQGRMIGNMYLAPGIGDYLQYGLNTYDTIKGQKEAEQERAANAKSSIEAMNQYGIQAPESLVRQMQPKQSGFERLIGLVRGDNTPEAYQQNVVQNPTQQQQEGALFTLAATNPELASTLSNLYNAKQTREFNKSEKEVQRAWDIEKFRQQQEWNRENAEANRDLRASIAGNRNAPSPVQVIDPTTGQPIYVRPEQAYGMKPFTAQTLKQDVAEANKEQQQNQAALSAQQVLDQAAILNSHPGRLAGTGASSWMSNIPGTEAKGFQSYLDTFKAQTFVPMVSALKGMGALSDAEGKKLTESVGALDPAMPEAEFQSSLKATTKFLYDKAKAAGLNVVMPDLGGQPEKQRARFEQTPAQGEFSIRPLPGQ